MPRLLVHVVIAVCALSAFGVQVCPHLLELGMLHVLRLLGVWFACAVIARLLLLRRVVDSAPPLAQPARQLWLDLGCFAGAGVVFMVFDHFFYGYPWNSGGRVLVGCVTLGLFAGLDTALQREREVLLR